jgi:competence protein ComEC
VLHKEIPFLRIGLPLCIGIISGLYFKPDSIFLLIVFIAISAVFTASLFYNNCRANIFFGIALTLALIIVGLILYQNEKNSISDLAPRQTILYCTVTDFPEEKANSYMMTLKLNSEIVNGSPLALNGSILVYTSKDTSVLSMLPGDKLIIRCTPSGITNRGNPYEFDYKFFMENHGIKYFAFTKSKDVLKHIIPKHRSLAQTALIIREKIIRIYEKRGIKGERLALVAAITLGQKNMLEADQKQIFIRSGVMHIMAVSGLHVVILSLFVMKLLFFMKGKYQYLRILITILFLWSFAFVTGLTPSVLRATLMFSFIQAGNLMQRKVNGVNSVLASAFVLIVIRPSVIFDAGFLLSYSAVIYIICFYQELYSLVNTKYWFTDKIWQSAAVTIAAQAGTLPLTIMFFNRFPTYFILTNIIIVPLSSVLVILGCLIPVFYPIRFISVFLAEVLNKLTGLTEYLTARASSLPFSNIENIGITTLQCLLLSVTLFVFTFYFFRRKTISPVYPLSVLLLFVLSGTAIDLNLRKSNEIIIYNTPGTATIGIRTGKTLNVYSDTALIAPEVLRHSSALGLNIRTNLLKTKPTCLRIDNETIMICNPAEQKSQIKNISGILILNGRKGTTTEFLTCEKPPKSVIITSEAAAGFRIPHKLTLSVTDTIHLVRKSGAFIKGI